MLEAIENLLFWEVFEPEDFREKCEPAFVFLSPPAIMPLLMPVSFESNSRLGATAETGSLFIESLFSRPEAPLRAKEAIGKKEWK